MADTTILAAGVADVPESYTVPATAVITPKSVNAVLDGTGASGSFVATLEVLNDAGIVVARSPVSTTTAAGGSAEVSWFPFVGGGGGATGGLPWLFASWTGINVTSGTGPQSIPLDPATVTWETSDSTMLALTNDTTGVYGPQFKQYGLYLLQMEATLHSATATAGKAAESSLAGHGYYPVTLGEAQVFVLDPTGGTQVRVGPSLAAVVNVTSAFDTLPVNIYLRVAQNSGVTIGSTGSVIVTQLNPTAGTVF